MSSSVEFEGSLESNGSRDITRSHGRMDLFEGGIEVGNIGLVMLGVMERHGFCGNGRLESVVIVGQIRKDKRGIRKGRKESCRRFRELRGELGRVKVDHRAKGLI